MSEPDLRILMITMMHPNIELEERDNFAGDQSPDVITMSRWLGQSSEQPQKFKVVA